MPFFRTLTISLILLLFITITLYAQRPLPETVYDSVNNRSIFVFSDQLHSGLNDNEARFAATHYVGCQKMPRVDIDRIRQFNENFIHLHYKLAITVDSIADYGMILRGNWFSNNRSPFSNWGQVREHPDWFLTHSGGKWTVHRGRRIVMDITNEGFREWWVSSCIQEMRANGCDGVFADTYTVAAIFGQTDNPSFSGSIDWTVSDWIPKLNEYGQYVYTRLDSAGFYFFPNIDNLQTTWANNAGTHYSKGDYLHAAMMESWGNWASSSDAFTGIQNAIAIQKKGVFIHGEGYYGGSHDMNPELSLARKRMWLAGTYLLVNHGRMYLSMYGPSELSLGMSRKVLWYPEFEIDLGPWVDEWNIATVVWKGVYRRRYEKGFVLVNNSSTAKSMDLEGAYYLAEDDSSTGEYWVDPNTGREKVGLKYTPVTSLQMPAFSAAVLLYEEPGCMMEPRGDFNGDGEFDMADIVQMIRSLMAGASDPCLDFNSDGKRNITDVVAAIVELVKTT